MSTVSAAHQAGWPAPGELLFEFDRARARWICELYDHGPFGVEARILKNEELFATHTFPARLDPTRTPREMAIAWALSERTLIEKYIA